MKPQKPGRHPTSKLKAAELVKNLPKKQFPKETGILETHNRFYRECALTKQIKSDVTAKLLIIEWLRNEPEL